MQQDFVSAILGGGAGLRMGRRKALVMLDGAALVEHVARALRPVSEKLAMIGDPAAAAAIGGIELADPPGFPAGPLSGVCAALEWAARENSTLVAVAPCDTPLLTADVFAQLASHAVSGSSVACAETADGLQPLVSIWRSDLAPWLRTELASGHPPVRDILARAGCVRVAFSEADAFLNINRPEDLQRAEAILRERRSWRLRKRPRCR